LHQWKFAALYFVNQNVAFDEEQGCGVCSWQAVVEQAGVTGKRLVLFARAVIWMRCGVLKGLERGVVATKSP
jgi:hypothetical protein